MTGGPKIAAGTALRTQDMAAAKITRVWKWTGGISHPEDCQEEEGFDVQAGYVTDLVPPKPDPVPPVPARHESPPQTRPFDQPSSNLRLPTSSDDEVNLDSDAYLKLLTT